MTDCATVSVSEAAKLLGVGRLAVYQAVREGRLPALRIGSKPKFRIPRLAIEQLLRNPAEWQRGAEE